MSTSTEQRRRMEAFFECKTMWGSGNTPVNSFAVIYFRSETASEFEEIKRTETVFNSTSPQYFTSFEFEFSNTHPEKSTLRLEFYNRQTEDSEYLHDHIHLGTSTIPVDAIIRSHNFQYATEIAHSSHTKHLALLLLNVEDIDTTNEENNTEIQLLVSAAILRRRDWTRSLVAQRFELTRAHKYEHTKGVPLWLPIYKSDRIYKQRDSDTILNYCNTALKYRHVCNGDDQRRLRISVFANQAGNPKKGCTEVLVAFVEFSLRDICEMDPTREIIFMENDNNPDTETLGHMSILQAQPTDYGSLFDLRLNYESTRKYTSAIRDAGKHDLKRKAKLAYELLMSPRNKTSGLHSSAKTLFA